MAERCADALVLFGATGDLMHRKDAVEAAWRIVDPVLGTRLPVHVYRGGSWGPAAAHAVLANCERWYNPRPSPAAVA